MNTTFLNLSEEELREEFCKLTTREDIAKLFQISDYQLRYHLYVNPSQKAYVIFEIKKKSGGIRSISAPKTALKIIQHKSNQLFQSVYKPKPSTHGFTYDKSIVTNAKQHLRQRYVLNLDLKDFFPSINFGRVRGLLMANPYNCTEEVATVFAQICCHNQQLPQGAPSSPTISNMICAKLDTQLQRLAQKYQCIYSRYADDITFSTSRSRFPSHLAWFSRDSEKLNIGSELKDIIEGNGFQINESKVRLQNRYNHQEVTGITVNEKLNIKRKYIRQIRAVLHAWEKYGLKNAEIIFWQKYEKHRHTEFNPDSFRQVIRGRIEYVGSVRGKDDQLYLKLLRWLSKLAPDLVNETKFDIANINESSEEQKDLPQVIIWTEGKTDIKHLRSALRWLQNNNLITRYKIDIKFKDDLDDQKQGSNELKNVCQQFRKEKQNNPLIAIFDRDEPDKIRDCHDETKGFKSWGNGVYSFAIPIPQHRKDNHSICIEFYYKDEEIKRSDSDGRRLFLSNEFHPNSGRLNNDLDLVTQENKKTKNNEIKIIDNVFDSNHKNVALSKDKFATYIWQESDNFNDFDFNPFLEIFDVINKISKHHEENIKSEHISD
jgi:RNA-directed DNA polymerase